MNGVLCENWGKIVECVEWIKSVRCVGGVHLHIKSATLRETSKHFFVQNKLNINVTFVLLNSFCLRKESVN